MIKTLSGRRASQNEYELREFMALLRDESVVNYLEVGAREGDTFFDIMNSFPIGSKGVALDLPGGAWGKASTRQGLKDCVNSLIHRGYRASFIFGDSQCLATKNLAVMRGPYDAILIDGDHRYDGVKADWESYRGLARLIAFHDIVGEGQRDSMKNPVEVPRLWAEIKAQGYKTKEFIDAKSTMGIGVVWMQ